MPPTFDEAATLDLAASYHAEKNLNPRDNSLIRISGMHQCRRQIAYRQQWFVQGKPELPISSHLYGLFDVGHGIHLKLQERLGNTGPLKWVDGEPAIDEHGAFGFTGLFEVALLDRVRRLRGTLDCLSRPLRKKAVRVKATGELFHTYEVTDEKDPLGKRYIIDAKSMTARQRAVIQTDPYSGNVLHAEIKPSPFEKLVQPKAEHVGQASMYAWMVTQPWFQHERLGGRPLETPPDIMILYMAKDLPFEHYRDHPDEYPDPKDPLNSPFKVFTVPFDQQVVDQSLEKVAGIWEHLDRGELPPREYGFSEARQGPRRRRGTSE